MGKWLSWISGGAYSKRFGRTDPRLACNVQLPGGIERFEFPLKPVGEVSGEISLPEGIDPSKLQLSFLSRSRTNDARTGYANTSIDAEGKFRVEKWLKET